MLFEILRGIQKSCEEFMREAPFDIVIFANSSWVENLPECTAMVPPPLPISHDTECNVVSNANALNQKSYRR
ncbi:hypothetical protein TRAPUB_7490 [Trametes pubescens]|uniref:Uncharacterized protein n=1 Tax=Trametes pubescens TaxID=154538 RepID=A0A1M2V3A6_TRAPU|nr:hypothetical protein TRAPUB_7490 [Trametes pubescens]